MHCNSPIICRFFQEIRNFVIVSYENEKKHLMHIPNGLHAIRACCAASALIRASSCARSWSVRSVRFMSAAIWAPVCCESAERRPLPAEESVSSSPPSTSLRRIIAERV